MRKPLPICVEMALPAMHAPGQDQPRFWQPGTVLHVRFLDGASDLCQKVASIAHEWARYASTQFAFDDASDAAIRVTFAAPGLWSYIGTDALLVPRHEATLGLGALNPKIDTAVLCSVVLHMFGHVLGMTHEHQNPAASIPWNMGKLYAYFAAAYAWTKEQVDANVLARYGASSSSFTMFDPKSIMLAPIPNELTVGDFKIGWNRDLSERDKSFMAHAYPLDVYAESIAKDVAGYSASPAGITQGESAKEITEGVHIEEHIRLDVARPKAVVRGEPFDLAVAVRQPNAPPLTIDDLPVVSSEEGTVYRLGAEDLIRYRIEVTGAACQVTPPSLVILLRPGENAKPRFFEVTAHRAGLRTIFVNAYQEDEALAAQTRVRMEVQVPAQEKPQTPSTATEEIRPMDIVLAPAEVKQFKEALLSAFGRGDLEQVVYYGLEVRLDRIVSNSNFDNEVNDLVLWVNDHNKVEALLKEARAKNSGNVRLREFDAYIRAKAQAATPATSAAGDPFQGQKEQLLDELSKLSVADSEIGRTSLLDGIPGADTFNRNPNIKRLDLDLIVTQLAQRGKMADGQSPLVRLIGNALPYAKGYEGEASLRTIQQALAQG